MKTLKIGAALAALALITPVTAFADEDNASPTRMQIEIVGTVASVVNANTMTVKVRNTSADDHAKVIARAMRDTVVTLTTDTTTVIRRATGLVPLTSVLVGDQVSAKAYCTGTAAPFTCRATRINATPAKVTKPRDYNVTVYGSITSIVSATSLTMRATSLSDDEHGDALYKLLHNQIVTVNADSKTVVKRDDKTVAFTTLAVGELIKAKLLCPSATPFTCTASLITVVPPKRTEVALLATVMAKTDATTLSVKVLNVSPLKDLKDPALALLNQTLPVTTDGKTTVRRGDVRITLAALNVGENVMVRAKCTTSTPLTCLADRIDAAAAA